MLDHRQKYALEMAVFELVNAIHSTRNIQNFDEVEAQALVIWNDTHGCDVCQAHWVAEGFGDGTLDGAVPVWKDCPDCQGHGTVI